MQPAPEALPLISVLIPVYNAQHTLERCLASVLAQSYASIEVVLVNDGSTDASGEVCERYAQNDARVRVLHQANAGSAAARNTALGAATGAYIAWVDADDCIWPTFLQHLYGLLGAFGTRVSMCRFQDIPNGEMPGETRPPVEADCVMDFSAYLAALHSPREVEMIVLWNKLYDAALWRGVTFPVVGHIDDAYVVWRLVHAAGNIAVSTLPLYFYCLTDSSIMRGAGAAVRNLSGVQCLYERYVFLRENGYAAFADATLRRYYQNIFAIWQQLAADGAGQEDAHAAGENAGEHAAGHAAKPAGQKNAAKRQALQTLRQAWRRGLPGVLKSPRFGRRQKLVLAAGALVPGRYLARAQAAFAGW